MRKTPDMDEASELDIDGIAAVAERVAAAVDVMGGIGHISLFTEDGQARRRAASTIRDLVTVLRIVLAERDAAIELARVSVALSTDLARVSSEWAPAHS